MSRGFRLFQASSVLVAASALLVAAAANSPAEADPRGLSTSVKAPTPTATTGPVDLMPSRLQSGPAAGQSQSTSVAAPPEDLGLRIDRLSAKQRERWRSIVRLVRAEDASGRPVYPTLRKMWDEVTASGHEVFVELREASRSTCCVAGLFRVDSVDAGGHIVAVVRLHLDTIDQTIVEDGASHGFRRFAGLGREERYAEVLGHELGHAVWTLADPARARRSMTLQSRSQELARALPRARLDETLEIRRRLAELGAQAEAQEVPARAAEAEVWRELVASLDARGERPSLAGR